MKKKLLSTAMALLIALVPAGPVYANEVVSVNINGQPVVFTDQPPVIVDGRTLVPVAGVFQALGFDVQWNGDIRQATLTRTSDTVVITIDSSTFTTNGISHNLDVPAQIIGGRTMLPIASVLRSVGYDVNWDGAASTVLIAGGTPIAVTPPPSEAPAVAGTIYASEIEGSVIIDGRTFVPIRDGIFQELGFDVTWLGGFTQATMLERDNDRLMLSNSNEFTLNSVSHSLDFPVTQMEIVGGIRRGPYMIAIAVLESLGYNVVEAVAETPPLAANEPAPQATDADSRSIAFLTPRAATLTELTPDLNVTTVGITFVTSDGVSISMPVSFAALGNNFETAREEVSIASVVIADILGLDWNFNLADLSGVLTDGITTLEFIIDGSTGDISAITVNGSPVDAPPNAVYIHGATGRVHLSLYFISDVFDLELEWTTGRLYEPDNASDFPELITSVTITPR